MSHDPSSEPWLAATCSLGRAVGLAIRIPDHRVSGIRRLMQNAQSPKQRDLQEEEAPLPGFEPGSGGRAHSALGREIHLSNRVCGASQSALETAGNRLNGKFVFPCVPTMTTAARGEAQRCGRSPTDAVTPIRASRSTRMCICSTPGWGDVLDLDAEVSWPAKPCLAATAA